MEYLEKRIGYEKKAIYELIASHSSFKTDKVTYTIYRGVSTQNEFKELILSVLRDVKFNYPKIKMINETSDTLIDFNDSQVSFRIYINQEV